MPKFLVNWFRGYGVLTPQNCHFPWTCCVALTTVHTRTAVQHCDLAADDADCADEMKLRTAMDSGGQIDEDVKNNKVSYRKQTEH